MNQATGNIRWILRIEGLFLFILSLYIYNFFDYSWTIFIIYFFVPDLSMLAYLINKKVGAISYNIAHSLIGVYIILGLGVVLDIDLYKMVGLIWLSHIGFDRSLGYGLKYEEGFTFTHLGKIGKSKYE